MEKVESFGSSLIPIALVAGLLSGGVIRTAPAPPSEKPRATAESHANGPGKAKSSTSLTDLWPVIELLGESLGVPVEADDTLRALRALRLDRDGIKGSGALADALKRLETIQADRSSSARQLSDDDPLQQLDAYLRSDVGSEAVLHKLQSAVANRLFDEWRDENALAKLTARATGTHNPTVDVQFMLATIPDYVDSNSGWEADSVLGAIQAAMSRAGFLLDRFRLIDWSRADAAHQDGVINESRLHERQPGALIFRNVDADSVSVKFEVVLLVPETPTGGVHRVALRNAIDFVYRWQKITLVGDDGYQYEPELRIVAPIYSGSVSSMAMELKDWKGWPSGVQLITGSAMADVNPCVVDRLAHGVRYEATLQPTSAVMNALQQTLAAINPRWKNGRHVALLVEGNTSFGASANATLLKRDDKLITPCPPPADDPFNSELMYTFPLHVSQLRDDAQAQPAPTPAVSLLPTPIVPLNFRETTPPSDQVPALRPQMTSPVTEAIVDNILDNIRHERVSAVGIVATDSRDLLFLAREVKKGAPDVQLFFINSYLLYLHPQYVPYMRGAVIASPYPLSLNAQRVIDKTDNLISLRDGTKSPITLRQAFPSLVAAGVFNATLLQLGQTKKLVDYCDPDVNFRTEKKDQPCRPPVWVGVIGDDAYWPLGYYRKDTGFVRSELGQPPRHHQMPLPIAAQVTGIGLVMLVAALVWTARRLCGGLRRGNRHHFSDPYVRVLAPPVTFKEFGQMHALALFIGTFIVASLSAWFAAVFLVQRAVQTEKIGRVTTEFAVWIVFALVMAPGVALARKSLQADYSARLPRPSGPLAPRPRRSRVVLVCSLALLAATIACFTWFVHGTILTNDSARAAFAIERVVAGGIVSPAPITICLFCAMLAGMVAGVRRLSMVGNGYTALAHRSPAFRLLAGMSPECPGAGLDTSPDSRELASRDLRHLTALLDMPVQNLPLPYVLAIVGAVVAFLLLIGRVSTIDGVAFSYFVTAASLSVLVTGLLLLAQSAATWNELKPKLSRLARTRLDRAFGSVGHVIRWDLSIMPPRLSELMPLVSRAACLRGTLLTMAATQLHRQFAHLEPNRRARNGVALLNWYESSVGVRHDDILKLRKGLVDHQNLDDDLRAEILSHKTAPLLQSKTWFRLWDISDLLVTALEEVHWKRCGRLPCEETSATEPAVPAVTNHTRESDQSSIDRWFGDGEEYVALQYAFVLRDVLARIMSSLFAAMLCLTLLTTAHLFYLFQGRSSLLTVDLLAIGVAAIVAIRIVVGMERDAVLSRLRVTTPGRVDFNWDFIKRVGIYGVLPLLAVIGSLFPEIGDSFFGWLEPIRKLASF